MFIAAIIIFCCLDLTSGVLIKNPIVTVEDGKLKGCLVEPNGGRPYYAFKEVPYAAPPVGDLRLALPVPPGKWSGVRDATRNTKICNFKVASFVTPDPRENEDCLYLNVYTPNIKVKRDSLMAVYVYIYGGMYMFGDPTEYNFQGFVDEDIVVVTFGYRSTLGFITTNDKVIPPNIGLKDQLFALKWVRRNIETFGGDPAKVTLGDHSSGAMHVGFHILNTKEKGLFRSAILQSGSPLASSSYIGNPRYFAYGLGEQLDPTFSFRNTSEELLKLLRSVPVEQIVQIDVPYPTSYAHLVSAYRSIYAPVIEDINDDDAFITGPMHDNFEKGISNHVPLLLGITSEEAIVTKNLTDMAYKVQSNISLTLNPTLKLKKGSVSSMATEFRDIYTKGKSYAENLPGFLSASSDLVFSMPVIYNAYLQSKYSDVYFYQFSYKSPYNGFPFWQHLDWFNPKKNGKAGHCDELPFLYYYRLNPGVTPTADDTGMRMMMIKLWTNFIKYTNPTPVTDPLLQNMTWPLVKQGNFKYLDIDTTLTVKKNPRRFVDWQTRLEKYFEHPRYCY